MRDAALDLRGVAEEERGVKARTRDAREALQQSLGARGLYFSRRLDELHDRGVDLEAHLLDALRECSPRGESELARDHRLRVVERYRGGEPGIVVVLRERGK